MRAHHLRLLALVSALASLVVAPPAVRAEPSPPAAPSVPPPAPLPDSSEASSSGVKSASPAAPTRDPTRGDRMRAYHDAMGKRRLGSQEGVTERLSERVAEAEALISSGRNDEAISKLTALVEHPRFDTSAETPEGRAALYLLGHALASAGITESARAYLRRSISSRGSWEQYGPYARRAVHRLVEVALDTRAFDQGLKDLAAVPSNAPPEVRAELAYLRGRAKQATGDVDGALAAYAEVPQTSRFWSQATYLSGLMEVDRGRVHEGETLFCKVADPKRQDRSVPVFADERFFAVRDLARLALGRVAHESLRHDDARYYYYLVPRDSDRLAEALYESATTRYERKDYEGARELLDELKGLKIHHRYEDEARILDAYIDLALCRFPAADAKLVAFLKEYEPVRDAARRLGASANGTRALLTAAQRGADAAGTDAASASVSPEQLRVVAALVRVDPAYVEISKKRAVLDHETSGLRLAVGTLGDVQRSLATAGGVRSAAAETVDPAESVDGAHAALDGVRRQLDELVEARIPEARIAPLRKELAELEGRLGHGAVSAVDVAGARSGSADLPDLVRADAAYAVQLGREMDATRTALATAETALASDALHRLDLRLSRLLRRARLGRIESVLGKKRGLEIEIEAIHAGYLPRDAVDSLDAARYLRDNEEYWPFEGDDWPDEFVGSEGLK